MNNQTSTGGFGDPILARNMAKIMQDHFRMYNAETKNEFDVTITNILEMTKFVDANFALDKTKWMVWNELTAQTNNIFPKLNRILKEKTL